MADGVYSQLYTARKTYEADKKAKEEEPSFWEKVGSTFLDVFTEIGGGFLKTVEGVVDAGIGIIGGIGGLFGADTQWADDAISFDATQEWYYSWEDELTKNSYINDSTVAKGIARGLGQQLPTIAAVALAPVTGGASLAVIPYTTGATIVSAGGQGMEEALNEDASYGQALLYGVLQSGIEGAVEVASAGLGKGISSIGKAIGTESTKSLGKVVLEEGLSEAFEEGLGALVDPLAKATYQGSDALSFYSDLSFYQDAAEQALIGGVVGAITAGSGEVVRVRNIGGVKNYSVADSVSEIATLDEKANNLFNSGKLTQENIEEINKERDEELQNLQNALQKMNESDRKSAIGRFNLSSLVDENGMLLQNSDFNGNLAQDGQTLDQMQNKARKPLASDNIQAYSPSLKNKELLFAPTQNNLTQAAQDAKKLVGKLTPNTKIVVSDSLDANINAMYDSKSHILYISNEATSPEIVGHEITHSLEGTEAYESLANFVLNSVENLNERLAETMDRYKDVNVEAKSGENGFDVALYEAQTEIVAEEMGKILSDEASVERIVNQNKGVAYKIWQWIKDSVTKLSKRGADNQHYKFLRKAEKLFAKAIKKSYGGIGLSDVKKAFDEEDAIKQFEEEGQKELANLEKNEYNKEKGVNNGQTADARYSINEDGEQTDTSSGRRGNLDNIRGQRTNSLSTIEHFQQDSKRARLESRADRQEYLNIVKNEYSKVKVDNIGTDTFVSFLEIDDKALVPVLKDIRSENQKLGFKTKFSASGFNVNGQTVESENALGLYSPIHDTIYLRVHEDYSTIETNNHERMHNIERKYPQLFNDFKNEAKSLYGEKYAEYVESSTKDWGNISFERKEKEFLSEVFAGSERVNFDENLNTKRKTLVEKYRKLLAQKANLDSLRYSIKQDSNGNKLTKSQQEFFKDSKVVDENGNLLVVYHGTNADFTVFDNSKGLNSIVEGGFYFTTNENDAKAYSNGGNVQKDYLNITGYLDMTNIDKSYISDVIDHIPEEQIKLAKDENIEIKSGSLAFADLANAVSHKWGSYKDATEVIKGWGFDGVKQDNETFVAFSSNQIKLTSNKNPTGSNDIRYSLKDASEFKSKKEVNDYYDDLISKAYKEYHEIDQFGTGQALGQGEKYEAFQKYISESHRIEQQRQEILDRFNQNTDEDIDEEVEETSSLPDNVEEIVLEEYGKTYDWRKTGYLLTDGTMVDMSQGSGRRIVDHRDVFDNADTDLEGTDAMVAFMERGNIRVSPEYPGINLQIEPTAAQYDQIRSFIEKIGWNEKFFSVDFDNAKGETIDNLTYENNISAKKIISDIEYYFKEGKVPYQSDLSQFRYSLKDNKGNAISKQQAEFFKDSKITDTDGNLLVVYHGTDADFTVFEKSKIGKNQTPMLSKGFYFADNPRYVKNYGKAVNAFYLNIKNPYMATLDDVYKLNDKTLKSQGYDGVIFPLAEDEKHFMESYYVAFESNQIKNIDNRNPTKSNDIRFSLKDGEGDYDYSKGQISKYVAERSRMKAYSKTDAEKIVNTIVSEQLGFGEKYGTISGKTKNQVIDTLWHALNTKDEGYRADVALDIAQYIIDNTVMEDIYANDTNEADMFVVSTMRNYLHNVDLSGIKSEIKNHYDKDNSPYLLWGRRQGTKGAGSPDTIAMELASLGIHLQSVNEADIFFEMDEMYRKSVKDLKKVAKQRLTEVVDSEDVQLLKQSIAKEILQGYDETGHKTRFAETIEKYTNKISMLQRAVKEIKANNIAKNNVVSTIERLRDKFVKNQPAGWNVPEAVQKFVKEISRVETWRNNISQNARQYISELGKQIDNVLDESQKSIYPFREEIAEIADGKGELTTQELQTLDKILRQFEWQLKNYDKVVFEGKSQSNTEVSLKAVKETKQASKIAKNNNVIIRFKNKVYTNPYDRLAEIGLYRKNSVAMKLYDDMLEGDRKRATFSRDASMLFDDFFKKNKKYLNDLQNDITITDGENSLTLSKRQALTIYATSLRQQGRGHLYNLTDSEGVIKLLDNKLSTKGKTTEAFARGRDVRITKKMVADIKNKLTKTDTEYLDLVKKFFNENSKKAKTETDNSLYGITNVEEGYYFPIKVSSDKIYTEIGQNKDINQYILDMGMNKSTKPNANNKIVIDGIDNILASHVQSMSLYYGYAVPLMAYNRIMNKQVLDTDGTDMSTNMRTEIQKFDVDFEDYMNKLWRDIQGISTKEKGWFSDFMSQIRWAGSTSALAANPKVLATQTVSLAAGVAEFSPKYIAQGMSHFFNGKEKVEMAKYSSLMWERNVVGNSVDIAEIRQIGKQTGGKLSSAIGKIQQGLNTFTTTPISWMDSNVINSLWYAAQYEVADKFGKGYEFGTEANKIEAGKRLDEVVFRTQQTSDSLGRSEWMRSDNELIKFARMFTGDAMQLAGKMIGSVNQYRIAKKMIKSGDAELVQQGQAMLGTAKNNLAKASSSFILNQAMLLAVAMAFKWLKGKDDDDEWSDIAQNELIANLMGLIPFGGDVYDILQGYEPTNMAYTALSDTVESVQDIYESMVSLATGEYVDDVSRNKMIRNAALGISRLTGVPLSNIESYVKGIVGKVSPATREEYESLFKTNSNTTYLEKIRKATENGDEALAESIINIMFDSKTGKIKDDKVMDVTRELIEAGYDVVPTAVNSTITYEGTTYTLTSKQYKNFTKIYSQATDAVKTMVNSSSFSRLSDEAKANAMNYIYDYYYDLALEDMLGVDLIEKDILFAEAIPISTLAMAIAQAKLYVADTDSSGNSISGTRKSKVQSFIQSLNLTATQKYMIMGYLGYSNSNGASQVQSYINRLNLTSEQKAQLYLWSGYSA